MRNNVKIYLSDRDRERIEVEYMLLRLLVRNKDANGVFSFPPINIGTARYSLNVDALSYDMSEMTSQSLQVLASTAGSDRIMIRLFNKKESAWQRGPVFRTEELKRLIEKLDEQNPGLKF